ncbi:MAG: carbon-nitrogen hydrolase family protein [Desulfurococcaceae archaeon]
MAEESLQGRGQVDVDYLGKSDAGRYIAIIHCKVIAFARKRNIQNVIKNIRLAKKLGARYIILPPFFNTGPVVGIDGVSEETRKKFFELTSDKTAKIIAALARLERVNIIVSGFLEKAGAYHYVSSLFINYEGKLLAKRRKLVVSSKEVANGIKAGKSIELFRIKGLTIGVVIDDEVYYPEIARVYRVLGASAMIASINPLYVNYLTLSHILKTRVEENSLPLMVPGSVLYVSNSLKGLVPSMVYRCDGSKIYEYGGLEQRLILVPLETLTSGVKSNNDFESLTHVGKIYFKALKDLEKITFATENRDV